MSTQKLDTIKVNLSMLARTVFAKTRPAIVGVHCLPPLEPVAAAGQTAVQRLQAKAQEDLAELDDLRKKVPAVAERVLQEVTEAVGSPVPAPTAPATEGRAREEEALLAEFSRIQQVRSHLKQEIAALQESLPVMTERTGSVREFMQLQQQTGAIAVHKALTALPAGEGLEAPPPSSH